MSELNKTYADKVVAESFDATTPENSKICKDLKFLSHGIVIRDPKGSVLWKQADHAVKVDDVIAYIRSHYNLKP